MKKVILLFFFLSLPLWSWSQVEEPIKGKMSFGIKAGWNQSTIYGSDLDFLSPDEKVKEYDHFLIGLTTATQINEYFGLKHEIYFQNYGAKFKREKEEGQKYYATLKMTSLKIQPVLPTFTHKDFEFYAGPYINVLLNGSITAQDEYGNNYKDKKIFGSGDEDTEEYKYLQKMDYGWTIGLDYKIKERFSIGVFYSRGLAPIFDNANTYGVQNNKGMKDLKIYNKSFGASLGYYF